jgi:hypothetical protein
LNPESPRRLAKVVLLEHFLVQPLAMVKRKSIADKENKCII